MAPEHTILVRLGRAGIVCLCLCTLVLSTSVSRADTSSMDSSHRWQWYGFSRSSWVPVYLSGTEVSEGSALTLSETSAAAVYTAASDSTSSFYSTVSADAGSASLSGVVFYDTDSSDGIRNSNDWGIADASVMLTIKGSTAAPLVAVTDQYGQYAFTNLALGDYILELLTPGTKPETPNIGGITDSSGHGVYTDRGTATDLVTISDIHLEDGYTGKDYDFPQLDYPASLLSKRMLINSHGGPSNTDPATPVVVPEPGSLMLLAMAGLAFGGIYWRRRRS